MIVGTGAGGTECTTGGASIGALTSAEETVFAGVLEA